MLPPSLSTGETVTLAGRPPPHSARPSGPPPDRTDDDQAGGDQYAGVAGVGAGGDRGQRHRAVPDLDVGAADGDSSSADVKKSGD